VDLLDDKITKEFGVRPSDLIDGSNEHPMISFLDGQINMDRKQVFPDAWLIRMESLSRLMKCSITLLGRIIESYNVDRIIEINLPINITVQPGHPRLYETCGYYCSLHSRMDAKQLQWWKFGSH
jgi:hypothetical protein